MDDLRSARRTPAAELTLVADARAVTLAEVPDLARFLVRAREAAAADIGQALGLVLPTTPLRCAALEQRAALWLGPDEWLLLVRAADAGTLTRAVHAALGSRPYSWVDVSHRNAGFLLSGPLIIDVLAAGCPLPLDAASFPVGKCTRTLYGKAEIVLWRTAESAFRIEVVRSFAAYFAALVAEAAREHPR